MDYLIVTPNRERYEVLDEKERIFFARMALSDAHYSVLALSELQRTCTCPDLLIQLTKIRSSAESIITNLEKTLAR